MTYATGGRAVSYKVPWGLASSVVARLNYGEPIFAT